MRRRKSVEQIQTNMNKYEQRRTYKRAYKNNFIDTQRSFRNLLLIQYEKLEYLSADLPMLILLFVE